MEIFKDPEVQLYLGVFVVLAIAAIALIFYNNKKARKRSGKRFGENLRDKD